MLDENLNPIYDRINKFIKEQLKDELENINNQEEANKIWDNFFDTNEEKIYKTFAETTFNMMKNTMYEEVMLSRANELEFMAIHEQKWCKAFVISEELYNIVFEAVEQYLKESTALPENEKKINQYTFNALFYIHSRALQQFAEITTLMKNGFADGAYARWRSMYELSVISSFIVKYKEPVAKAYIDASDTDDRYNWANASGVFSNKGKHITFNDIQKNVCEKTNPWYKQYVLANKIIHASPQGTFKRLSDTNTLIGRCDYGITTPAEHSAKSLGKITNDFFLIHPSPYVFIALNYIYKWIENITEVYFKTHDELFPEDEKLWKETMYKK